MGPEIFRVLNARLMLHQGTPEKTVTVTSCHQTGQCRERKPSNVPKGRDHRAFMSSRHFHNCVLRVGVGMEESLKFKSIYKPLSSEGLKTHIDLTERLTMGVWP